MGGTELLYPPALTTTPDVPAAPSDPTGPTALAALVAPIVDAMDVDDPGLSSPPPFDHHSNVPNDLDAFDDLLPPGGGNPWPRRLT